MRKNIFGRRLKRDKNERKALFKNLMSSLVLEERIKTTEAKAKSIKGEVDKLVTTAKKDSRLAKKLLGGKLTAEALEKLINNIVPRFTKRQSGYARTVRLGKRFGDDASMVLIEWVEGPVQNLESVALNKKDRKEEKSKSKKETKKTPLKKEVKKLKTKKK